MWKHLNHPHIVPFMGVTLEPLQLVSGWMPGGELRSYIKTNPHTNLISLVSQPLPASGVVSLSSQLLGVAEGLMYLYSCNVIHGDLKGVRRVGFPCVFSLTNTNPAEHTG